MLSNCLTILCWILFWICISFLLLSDEGIFIYIMDNGAILNILSHKYSSSPFGPLAAFSTHKHVRKLGFLKNVMEKVVCQ